MAASVPDSQNAGDFLQGGDLYVRPSREDFLSLSVAVAPDDSKSESRSSVRIPRIGRDKTDRLRGDREGIEGELVDRRMRFVDACIFN